MKASLLLMGMMCLTGVFFTTGCSKADPMADIKKLETEGKIADAKQKFKDLVDAEKNPNLDRQYIQFLFRNNQFADFRTTLRDYLSKHPEDKEIKNLEFEYYARLVNNAEKAGSYEDAHEYLVAHLLSPEYKDYRKWESRQTTILRKWFNQAKEKNDTAKQKYIMLKMINHGFENLATSLDPVLYDEIQTPQQAEEEKPTE